MSLTSPTLRRYRESATLSFYMSSSSVLDLCKCAYMILPHVYIRVRHTSVRHTHTCLLLLHVLGDACKPSAFHNTHDHACAKSQNRLVYMIYFVMRMPMCTQHPSSDQAVAMGLEEQGSSESTDLCGCDVRVFFMLLQSLHCFGTVFRFFFLRRTCTPKHTHTLTHALPHTNTHTGFL